VETEVSWDWLRVPTPDGGPPPLPQLHRELVAHRGFETFSSPGRKLRCDLHLPTLNLVVEIDEGQHFTAPRALALGLYDDDVSVAFSVERWVALSRTKDRHDNSPPYRDEQRAYYDAVRDVLVHANGLRPVVRLMEWELEGAAGIESGLAAIERCL